MHNTVSSSYQPLGCSCLMLTFNKKHLNECNRLVYDRNQFGNIVLLQICIEVSKTAYFHLYTPQLLLPADLYDFLPQLCYYYVAFNDPRRENLSLRSTRLKYQQCCGGNRVQSSASASLKSADRSLLIYFTLSAKG